MKIMFKKSFCLLFALMLLVSVFAVTASADEINELEEADVELFVPEKPLDDDLLILPAVSEEPVVIMPAGAPASEGLPENADGIANDAEDTSSSGGNMWIIIVAAATVIAVIAVAVIKSKKK